MNRVLQKLPIHALVVGILLGMTVTLAFAQTVSSPEKSIGCYLGYCYTNQAELSGEPAETFFQASATVFADNQVPTGYIGVKARLIRNGAICRDGDWSYNSSSFYGYGIGLLDNCGAGDYQGYGFSKVYNAVGSDGYSWNTTYYTPVLRKN